MAGTVMTQRMSSPTMLVADWSLSSWRAWSRKNLSACANTDSAEYQRPFAARIDVSLFRFYIYSANSRPTTLPTTIVDI